MYYLCIEQINKKNMDKSVKGVIDEILGEQIDIDEMYERVASSFRKKLIKYDISHGVDSYTVKFSTPGVKKEDLELKVIEGRLRLDISNSEYAQEVKINSNIKESSANSINAKYEDGILYVTVPNDNFEPMFIKIS